MKHLHKCFLVSAMILAGIMPAHAALKLEVEANRDSIYIGEAVMLTVKVSGAQPTPTPDLSAIKDATVTLLGSRNENYSRTYIANGKRTHHAFRGAIFTYSVTPQKTGTLRLGPISATAGSSKESIDGPSVKVTGIEDQDDVIVRIDASRGTVLVDENFEITLHIYIKCLTGVNANTARLPSNKPPHLSIPYFAGNQIEGLEHTDTRTILQGLIASRPNTPSFSINSYSIRNDPFDFESMFNFNAQNRETPAPFVIPVTKTELNGESYWHYQIATHYIAREERTHTFGPVIFKGDIIDSIDSLKYASAHSVFSVGPSQTVRVVPPPEENRPGSFVGAVGTNMLVDASLDTQNCRVGDPLTLTLTVSGGVNLKNVYPPDLSYQAERLKQFRVYEDTLSVKRDDKAISFVYTVRPTSAGSLELPPLDISYFDSSSRTYRTVQTPRIPVTAAEAGGIDSDMILGGATNAAATASHAGSGIRYVAPFVTHQSASHNKDIGLGLTHIFLLVGAPLLFLFSLTLHPIIRIRRDLGSRSRRRGTYTQAVAQLKKASSLPAQEAAPKIAEAMRLYVGDRFAVKPEALTPPDMSALIRGSGIKDSSVSEFESIAERVFNASFSASSGACISAGQDAKRVIQLIDELESISSKDGHSSLPMLLLILATICSSAMAGIATSDESDFLWQKAWTHTLSADGDDAFRAAAKDYSELIGSGIRNEYIFYNMGTAFLMSGDYDKAQIALERAERYGGMNARLLQNVQITAAGGEDLQPGSSWLRVAFFWHYLLPMMWRIDIAIAAWTTLFILLAMGGITGRRTPRIVLIVTISILAAFGSSSLTSLLQENQARIMDSYISQPLSLQGGAK